MSWRLVQPDPPEGGELPAAEFVQLLPLAALALLAVNDHLLKGAGLLPGWLTGKLSDFAGLFFFPLLVTALIDTLLHLANGVGRWRFDASLRLWKLLAAAGATAALFLAIKLSPWAAEQFAAFISTLWRPVRSLRARVVVDPTDLLALPMLAVAVWHGRRGLAEIPPGRLATVIGQVARGGGLATTLRRELRDCAQVARATPRDLDALVRDLGPYLAARAQGRHEVVLHAHAVEALRHWRALPHLPSAATSSGREMR